MLAVGESLSERQEESTDDSFGDNGDKVGLCIGGGDKIAICLASQSRTRAKRCIVNRESNRASHHTWEDRNHTRITLGVLEHEYLSHKSGYHVAVEGFSSFSSTGIKDRGGSSKTGTRP